MFTAFLYVTVFLGIGLIVCIAIVFGAVILSPVWMYFFQKNRDKLFQKLASTHGLEFHKEKTFAIEIIWNAQKENRALRYCEGKIKGKDILFGDFYYTTWLNLRGPLTTWGVKYGLPIKGVAGAQTIFIIDGKIENIGSSITGYASEAKILNLINSI